MGGIHGAQAQAARLGHGHLRWRMRERWSVPPPLRLRAGCWTGVWA